MMANLLPALALFQETAPAPDTTMLRVICAVGAVVLLGLVILRRRSKKKHQDQF